MEELKILVKLLDKKTTKSIEVINSKFSKSQKQYELYQKILDEEVHTDYEASVALYPNTNSSASYVKLKYRLRKRLLNTLFLLDLNKSKNSNYNQAKIESFKNWAIANLLINKGARKPAISICHTLLKHSRKYDFTDLAVLSSRILCRYYSSINIDQKKYHRYEKILFQSLEIFNLEIKAEAYYFKINNLYLTNKNSKLVDTLLEKYCAELESLTKQHKTYTLLFNYYQLETFKFVRAKEYIKAKEVCNTAIQYLKSSNADSKIAKILFQQELHYCHLVLGEFKESKRLIQLNLKQLNEGGYNWFREWHSYFIWGAFTKNYKEMVLSVETVLKNKQLKKYPHLNELWKIKEAYMYLLLKSTIFPTNSKDSIKNKKFRVGKFLNEVPIYSKDKQGLNIAILIIHLLLLITNKKYDDLLNRLEALKQYSYRHLRQDSNLRSNIFIKMLCKTPDANYHPIALKRHTKKLYEKLSTTSYTSSDSPAEIEVIPYENLWEIVLEVLAKNQKKR